MKKESTLMWEILVIVGVAFLFVMGALWGGSYFYSICDSGWTCTPVFYTSSIVSLGTVGLAIVLLKIVIDGEI